jgi:hypothetical protein
VAIVLQLTKSMANPAKVTCCAVDLQSLQIGSPANMLRHVSNAARFHLASAVLRYMHCEALRVFTLFTAVQQHYPGLQQPKYNSSAAWL